MSWISTPPWHTWTTSSLEQVFRKVSGLVDPFVVSHGRVVAKTGETIYGEFITLPRTAEQLAADAQERSGRLCPRRPAPGPRPWCELVGLGAFTSVVTLGGRAVTDEGVPVTTGNSYAAVASAEAARKALALAGPIGVPTARPYRHHGSHRRHWSGHGPDAGRGRGPADPGRQSRFVQQPCPRTFACCGRRRG